MFILPKPVVDVQSKPQNYNTNGYIPSTSQARSESAPNETKGAATTSLKEGKLLLAKDLKQLISLKELMESDGH